MHVDLSGSHALVGGASQGIGKAIAVALGRSGAAVSLLARRERVLEDAARDVTAAGGPEAYPVVADLDDPTTLGERVRAHLDRVGPADIWIHNTGGPPSGALAEAEPDAIAASVTRHVVSGQVLLQAVLPGMHARRRGRIVTITSTSVREPLPHLGVSNLTRAAVHGWAKSLSHELPPYITINDVLPGFTDTPRLRSLAHARAQATGTSFEQVWAGFAAGSPAQRIAAPEEIAAAVVFLCSDQAGYITGVALPVDGGRTRAF